jgi:hypothetical protein
LLPRPRHTSASIGDQYVDSPQFLGDCVNEPFGSVRVAQVRRYCERPASSRANVCGELFCCLSAAVVRDCNVGSGCREGTYQGGSDIARRPGDQGNSAVET